MKVENNLYQKYVSQINMDLANHNIAKREEKTESKRDTVEYKIASAIMHGGKVSPEDENKLAQWDPALYMMAKQAAMMQKQKNRQEELPPEEEETKKTSDGDDTFDSPLNHISSYTIDMTIESNDGQMGVTNITTTEHPANFDM